MQKETKIDILTMLYQFVFCGTLFWLLIYLKNSPKLSGSVISTLDSISTSLGIDLGFFIISIFIIFGTLGLYIQRRISLKKQKCL